MNDAEMIRLYQQRDEQALTETKKRYEALCMTVAYNLLGNREDAEECVNDALMRLWQAIPPAEPVSLGAYLLTAVRNAARDRLTYQKAQRRGSGLLAESIEELSDCLPSADHPDRMIESIALRDALNRFLSALKPTARMIFLRRYWLCLSVKEVAAETGCSFSRVNMSLLRTRKKLKDFLEQEELL